MTLESSQPFWWSIICSPRLKWRVLCSPRAPQTGNGAASLLTQSWKWHLFSTDATRGLGEPIPHSYAITDQFPMKYYLLESVLSWFLMKGAAGIKCGIDFWDVAQSSRQGRFKKCKVFLFFHTWNRITFTEWRSRLFYVTLYLSPIFFFISSSSLHLAVFLSPPWVFIASLALLLAPALISAFSPALLSAFRFWSNFSCLLPVLLSLLSIFLTLTCSPFCGSDSNSSDPVRSTGFQFSFLPFPALLLGCF